MLARLRAETFDLLVIGGGITGVGAAFDAALRGLRVALVEKDDFASGTSSRSSKLLHGGLRYLAHLEVGLVREALRERGILQRMVPHLVTPMPFVIPRYGKRRLLALRAGLDAYDVLALGSGFPRHRKLEPDDVVKMAPSLDPSVKGGHVYWDARTDDARLVWTVARTAIDHGAAVANHAEVIGLMRSGPAITGRGRAGRVIGAAVRDRVTGAELEVRAKAVVNATGVWSDDVRALESSDERVGIRPSKGIHVVLRAETVPVNSALGLPAPDGRYVFVIPWEDDRVVVGTTDEDYGGPLETPRAEPDEIAYLLDVVNRVLAEPVSADDIVATYAGLRPLIQRPGQSSKDLSRRHKVLLGSGGVVTITGGKLTTWRPMAADAVDAALESGGFADRPRSTTEEAHLAGGHPVPGVEEALAARAHEVGVPPEDVPRLQHRYGTLAAEVLDLVAGQPALAERLHPDVPELAAEAAYAVRAEMAVGPDDVLSRRLRVRLTAPDRGLAALDRVTALLGGGAPAADAYRADVAADLRSERGGV